MENNRLQGSSPAERMHTLLELDYLTDNLMDGVRQRQRRLVDLKGLTVRIAHDVDGAVREHCDPITRTVDDQDERA